MMGWQTPHRVLVVGIARSGCAAAHLAARDGAELLVTDCKPAHELENVRDRLPVGTSTFYGGHPSECLDDVGLVVASPGVSADAPVLVNARSRGIPVLSEIEFAWLHIPAVPLVAVTGSNGKSTVTTLIAEMLTADGRRARAGGNLGTPASELVMQADDWDVWVLEMSSFQTELLTSLRPRVGVFLNLSQDHLERHHDLVSYQHAKQRLLAFQQSSDTAVLNADDPMVAASPTDATVVQFSLNARADAYLDSNELHLGAAPLLHLDELALSGRHNAANALAASLAADAMGVGRDALVSTLRSFAGLAHRHQTVLVHNNVRWVDDSKATNVGATLAGLQGYPDQSVHLVLGGLSKGQSFTCLVREVTRAACRVYLIGRDRQIIATALAGAAPLEDCGTLESAVAAARCAARPGHTVLLAPACASFDQFTGFAERGERFATLASQGTA